MLVLASQSPYRRKLLRQLGLEFQCAAPAVDETPLAGESADGLVVRLAVEKARAGAAEWPGAVVIGADQVVECKGEIFGKPGTVEAAVNMLRRASGMEVKLYTGLALIGASGREQKKMEIFHAKFRPLDEATIQRYVAREKPLDCAGAVRAEGPGIALLERLRGDDPNTLIGLPLIALVRMLEAEGVRVV